MPHAIGPSVLLTRCLAVREDPGRQLRVHDTRDTTMRLLVANDPIIETCDGIVVAPAPDAAYPEYSADLAVRPPRPGKTHQASAPRANAGCERMVARPGLSDGRPAPRRQPLGPGPGL